MEYTFTAANFEEEVLQSELPVLVDFSAASTSGGAVLFCWVMKNIPII